MRIGRVQDLAHQHARHAEVVGVLAVAGDLLGRIDHRHRLPDDGEVVAHAPLFRGSISIPASSGSRTMAMFASIARIRIGMISLYSGESYHFCAATKLG